MPLQNRVAPDGTIHAVGNRGTLMGNRGGRIHGPGRVLSNRRWASKAWIACVLEFKNRHRMVMAPNSYTELFFLDEATALAAGHRPCFECRRSDAVRFAELWALTVPSPGELRRADAADLSKADCATAKRARAHEMDTILHRQRIAPDKPQLTSVAQLADLPTGVMVRWGIDDYLVYEGQLIRWSFAGYERVVRGDGTLSAMVLTPPRIVEVLRAGYQPQFHRSVLQIIGNDES